MFEFDHEVPGMESIAEVLDYLGSRTRVVPEGQWIWVQQVFVTRLIEQRFPTRAELDAAAPRHPVVFSTGPDAMVNSLALSASGITSEFKVTGAGSIERDPATGDLTGMLRGGTKRYLKSTAPPSRATEEDRLNRLEQLLRDYNSNGITSIADRDAGAADIDRYEALRRAGRLPVRVAVSHSVDAGQPVDAVREAIKGIANHPLRIEDVNLRIVGIKTYLDGGMLTGSALMRRPWGVSRIYRIDDPEYVGVRFIPEDKLREIVSATVAEGLQFTAHSVGDAAVLAGSIAAGAPEVVNRFPL
jgi:predicted amidohydrolase YtcJ